MRPYDALYILGEPGFIIPQSQSRSSDVFRATDPDHKASTRMRSHESADMRTTSISIARLRDLMAGTETVIMRWFVTYAGSFCVLATHLPVSHQSLSVLSRRPYLKLDFSVTYILDVASSPRVATE